MVEIDKVFISEAYAFFRDDEFVSHHGRFNAIIKARAAELKIGYADNDEVFAGNPDYFLDLVHYSKAGVERLAENYEAVVAAMIEGGSGLNVSDLWSSD